MEILYIALNFNFFAIAQYQGILGSVWGQYKVPFPMVKMCLFPKVFRENSPEAHKI